MILFLTIGGITTACYIARTGKVGNVFATLFALFVIGGVIKALL